MKKQLTILFLFLLQSCLTITIYAQGGTWTWISGDSTINALGVYGTQGVPSVNNHPPAVYVPCEWKDAQGNFWIYGGNSNYSDLWKFNPSTLEWTWVKGDSIFSQLPVFGIKGIPNLLNTPGHREFGLASWVDNNGDFWLYGGGFGIDDLWKYEINTNMWTWVSGSQNYMTFPIYGTKGVPSPNNSPGARWETSCTWVDNGNNLWMYGGNEVTFGTLNNLWKYNISLNEWVWMSGNSTVNHYPNYGIKGTASPANNPGSRTCYSKWKGLNGDFWIFGGTIASDKDTKNDLWTFKTGINQWVWMAGKSNINDSGNYFNPCVFDSLALPNSRFENRASVTDNCGRFWLFGGFILNNFSEAGFSDLWVFDPPNLNWALLSGTNLYNQVGNFGLLGIPSITNYPRNRGGAVAWWGNDNKYYLFGGQYGYLNGGNFQLGDLWVFDPDTNCISVCPAKIFANFASSDSLFCEKQCIDFTDISQNNPTAWQWTFTGGAPSTSTDQNPTSICYNSYGSYDVTLVACNQFVCDTITKNNFITSYITPFDSIWFANDTLFAFPANSYQWYEVGAGLIANATLNYYVPLTLGNYYCITKDSDGCESTSNVILITSFFENENSELANAVWPNPANEILFINPELLSNRNIIFEIYDMQGRIILQQMLSNNKNSINIALLATSVYSYRIMTQEKIIAQGRIVKGIKN